MAGFEEISSMSTIKELQQYGQSVWIDYIQRSLMTTGKLGELIRDDGIRGLTSNPSIFAKAIAESGEYDAALSACASSGKETKAIYESLAIADIQMAADVLRPVYDDTKGRDGLVSLEVSPEWSRDAQGTIEEARRLWSGVCRDNLMIKVPGTPEGIVAMEALTADGINVNVTLLFDVSVYARVAAAYIRALSKRMAKGLSIERIASVASFFVSRVDSAVDTILSQRINTTTTGNVRALDGLLGKAAIANSKLAYAQYLATFKGVTWNSLAEKGAQTQRLLWASTGTKNPNYLDVMYVEELVGPDTVSTIPPATLAAFRHHGRPRSSLATGLDSARAVIAELAEYGVSMPRVTDDLLCDGEKQFADAYRRLLGSVAEATTTSFKQQDSRGAASTSASTEKCS